MPLPKTNARPSPGFPATTHGVISPTYFTSIVLDGINIDSTIAHYLDWIEGVGHYRQRRKDRSDLGVPSPIDRNRLLEGGTISDPSGSCDISARRGDGRSLIRFIHRDKNTPGVCWHSVIRLSSLNKSGQSILIEHGAGRIVPPHLELPPQAGAPRILDNLRELPGVTPQSRDLFLPKVTDIGADEAERFVRYILLDDQRSQPYLVVSETMDDGMFLVDPNILAQRLSTQVIVVSLRKEATRSFSRAFESGGFAKQFGACFNGAARIYHVGLNPNQHPHEHYLWLPDRLRMHPSKVATERLAGEVAQRVTWRALPLKFFSIIEEWDRAESRVHAEKLIQLEETRSLETSAQSATISDLKAQLRKAQEDLDVYQEVTSGYEADLNTFRQLLEIVEQERDEAVGKAAALSDGLSRRRGDTEGLSLKHREALRSTLSGGMQSLSDALHVLESLYADRVVILPSAWESAKESSSFSQPEKAWTLMNILVTDYWAAIQEHGDTEARKVFSTNAYAARESETVENNDRAKQLRTFTYKGESLPMMRHLRIGVKDSVKHTFRLHFEFDAEEKKIVIGHCGKHLDFN